MEEIIGLLNALKEDKTNVILTDEIIKEYILDNIDCIIKEIKEEL